MAFIPKSPKKRTYAKEFSRIERQIIYQHPRWRPLRNAYISENPLCEKCQLQGITTPATDIHHRISFMETTDPVSRYNLAFDYSNLEALCSKCHQSTHHKK